MNNMPLSSISTQTSSGNPLIDNVSQKQGQSSSLLSKRSSAAICLNEKDKSVCAQESSERRSNEEWLMDLRGLNGANAQHLAHQDLSAYLYVVVLNYLHWKYAKSTAFADIHERDIATFVGDFVQDFMVKLVRDDYALLGKYSGRGRFTSWCAQVAHNLAGGEMRKAYWRRETETAPDDMLQIIGFETRSPESIALQNTLGEMLLGCMEKLPTHYRHIIERCILLEESATDIANEENVTPNSVYIRLHRAKEQLRKLASAEGIELHVAL